jgi:hypothetical protein
MTHTPGPWFIGSWHGQCHIVHEHDGRTCKYDYELLTTAPWNKQVSAGDAETPLTMVEWHGDEPMLSADDARLIAAAPELLVALKASLRANETLNYVGPAINMARAAIAKAEGK